MLVPDGARAQQDLAGAAFRDLPVEAREGALETRLGETAAQDEAALGVYLRVGDEAAEQHVHAGIETAFDAFTESGGEQEPAADEQYGCEKRCPGDQPEGKRIRPHLPAERGSIQAP